MTDDDLKAVLTERVAAVRKIIATSAEKVGRDPSTVTLVAVTKTVSPRVIAALDVVDCAENRPQAFWPKAEALPGKRWHFIGHLQRNKLDRTLPLAHLFHAADSDRILGAVNTFGGKAGRRVPILLEVNCSGEAAKGGFRPEEVPAVAADHGLFEYLDIRGLMTMAAYADDPESARPTFAMLRKLRETVRKRTGLPLPELSMGMSGDYAVAVEEGATLVRVGTVLFTGLEGE